MKIYNNRNLEKSRFPRTFKGNLRYLPRAYTNNTFCGGVTRIAFAEIFGDTSFQ